MCDRFVAICSVLYSKIVVHACKTEAVVDNVGIVSYVIAVLQ